MEYHMHNIERDGFRWRHVQIRDSLAYELFKNDFLNKYKSAVLPSYEKALSVMEVCRTESGPQMLATCTNVNCSNQTYVPHSCGHRNCPHCQNYESQRWIEN